MLPEASRESTVCSTEGGPTFWLAVCGCGILVSQSPFHRPGIVLPSLTVPSPVEGLPPGQDWSGQPS